MSVRRIIQESTAPEVVADSPGPVPRSKEEHLTDESIPQSTFPENVLLHSRDGLLEVAHGLCLPGVVGPVLYVRADQLLVAPPREQAPDVTFHGDPFPPYCCDHCESRKREGLAVKARANLLRQAVHDREVYGVVCHHAVELVEMLRARGLA